MGNSSHGFERKASGSVNTTASVPNERHHGVGRNAGVLSVNALAGAVPAGSYMRDGIAFSSDGRMCTTTSGVGVTLKNGIGVRSDGAVLTVNTGPTAASRIVHTPIGSFLVDANGAVHTG